MSGRANAMATINNSLAGTPPPVPSTSTGGDTGAAPVAGPSATSPAAAPPVPGSKEAKEQEKAAKEQEKAAKEQEKAAEAEKKAEEEKAEEEKARTSGQVDALTGVAKSTFETKHPSGLDFLKLQNLGGIIESLPTPGSFMFPLILLLLFFFILIPVNGHTRAVWLWMAITGDALINPGTPGAHQGSISPQISPPSPPDNSGADSPMISLPTQTLVEGS